MAEVNIKNTSLDMSSYLEQGFDWMQCEEIRKGMEDGVDVAKFKNVRFSAPQMREIRLGLGANFDVSLYARPELDANQMREIRHGIESGVSMVAYANPRLKPLTIRALALGKQNNVDGMVAVAKGYQGKIVLEYVRGKMAGVDLMEYMERGFDADQLEALTDAHKKKIKLDPYLGLNLYGVQLQEIITGIESGVNVSVYATGGFNWMQMKLLRECLEQHLNIKPLLNPGFSLEQMKEIRTGIVQGVDVTKYARVGLDPEQMRDIRENVKDEGELGDKIDEILAGSSVSEFLTMDDLPTLDLDFDIGAEAEKLLEQEEVVDPALALAKELIGEITQQIDDAEEIAEEIKNDIQITVAEDKMSAVINIIQPIHGGSIGVREITRALREYDIKQGIKKDLIKEIVEKEMFFTDIVIAEGKPAVKGVDGFFTYYFRKDVKSTPKILPNGSVDYKGIELFETVEKDQVIAEYTPATAGEFGYNVEGTIVKPERGRELPTLKGTGFHISEDKRQYIADLTGIIEWVDEDKLEIRNVYNVEGDVDLSVGNINFDGDVYISGNVDSGFMISASGNVSIEGSCEGCSIFSGADILVKGGVQGKGESEIRAGGNIIGQFFESAKIIAEGDVTCTYLLNCDTVVEGSLNVAGRRGVIIGGHCIAKTGIECFGIGNVAQTKSVIEVGVSDGDTRKYQELMNKCEKVQNDIKTLEEGIEKILNMPERSEQVMEFYDKLTRALQTQKDELKMLLEERERSIVKMTKQKLAEIDVKGTVYPGTRVFISSVPYIVRDTLKNVRFLKKDGKVGYQVRAKL